MADEETNTDEPQYQEQDSLLGKSDEEILGMDLNFLSPDDDDEPGEESDTGTDGSDDDGAVAPGGEADQGAEGDEADEATAEGDDPEASADSDTPADGEENTDGNDADKDKEPAEDKDKDADKDKDEFDYKAAYEQLTAPFKANGREMKVDNIDEALQLMKMGANYNKKMGAIKPHLKMVKMLENNDLLDEEKLSFLIDVNQRNPEAIAKLLKDGNIDPMDLDTEKGAEYKPNTYTVDDREVDLDMVIDELKGSPHYASTIELVSTKWDKASKQAVADTPQLLKVINEHMDNGVYDVISGEMDRQRAFGKLNGLSDIEAYKQVGDSIQARGGFDHLFQDAKKQGQSNTQDVDRKVVTPKPKADDEGRKAKRRAAAPSKAAAPAKKEPDFNPLALSDEEFEKMGNAKFM